MDDRCPTAPSSLALALLTPTARAEDAKPHKVDFDRQVRPILSNNCFPATAPTRRRARPSSGSTSPTRRSKPADSGQPAIVPGKPDESPLVRRIFSKRKAVDDAARPRRNKTLSDADKAVLRAWIEQGADYQTHWSFAAPRRPPSPAVKDAAWPREPDRPLHPRPAGGRGAAARRPRPTAPTLIRRVDARPDRAAADAGRGRRLPRRHARPTPTRRLVDRLLASPHYGERMALDWLDAARYADTHGYHIDSGRDMTRWRDWVIDAFNRNLPFDRFTDRAARRRPAARRHASSRRSPAGSTATT